MLRCEGEGMFTRAEAVTWNELNSCESRKTAQTFHSSSIMRISFGCVDVDVSEKMSAYFPSNKGLVSACFLASGGAELAFRFHYVG